MMRECPFCGGGIQEHATRCKHCGQSLLDFTKPRSEMGKMPWYFRTSFIIMAVCTVGPLALPLIWRRPHTSPAWKIGLTVVILVVSWIVFQATMESIRSIKDYGKTVNGLLK